MKMDLSIRIFPYYNNNKVKYKYGKNDKDGENDENNDENEKIIKEARERLRGVIGKIDERLTEFRRTHILIGTIVPINIRRIQATADCLYPPTQFFLEKMVV